MATRANTSTRLPITELFLRRNVEGLICDAVSPSVYVSKKTGKFYQYDNSNLKVEDDMLSSRGGANEVEHDYSTANFDIVMYGLKEWIDADVYDDADPMIKQQARQSALLNIKDKLLLNKEARLSTLLFSAGNFAGKTAALAGANQWDNAASDPFSNFVTAAEAVMSNCGMPINTLILGYEAMNGLQYNPAVLDLLGDNSVKSVTKALLAKLFMTNGINIPENNIFVGTAQQNTAAKGATDAFSYIWGKSALFCYIDRKANTIQGQTLVKTFRLKDFLYGNETFEFYPDPDKSKRGEWCHGRIGYQHNLVNNNCGYLFTTVVS